MKVKLIVFEEGAILLDEETPFFLVDFFDKNVFGMKSKNLVGPFVFVFYECV